MMDSLNAENFFKYFIIHPSSDKLKVKDRPLAWVASIILGFATLGMAHLIAALVGRRFTPKPSGTRTPATKLFREIHHQPAPGEPIDQAERVLRYGNKTANLMSLKELFEAEDDVVVPDFTGIDRITTEAYIQTKWPQFNTLWQAFVNEGADPSSPHLLDIQKGVQTLFREANDFPPAAVVSPLLAHRRPLMVRSTGKEDSLEVANPGGNESLSNVAPNIISLRGAIGDVLASYFSAKSLAQRKLSGDDITVPPPLPVLLQVMFGEEEGGAIPTCGVMYTREPELMTEGIIQICSTLGHAEGVVTGSAPCDTYYVTESAIHSIVEEKPSRRAPAAEGGLEAKPNPTELRLKPTLNAKELKRLAAIGRKIEEKYGHPMDIEWGYNREEGRFYLFQARPIPPKESSAPSYISPGHLKMLEQPQKITALGTGGGRVLSLNKSNTLFSSTAASALASYLANPVPKPTAVLVTSPAARNSHEAAFFRSVGIPLIQVSTKGGDKIAALLEKQTLLVDTQEGTIGALPVGSKEDDFVTPGLRRFLAPSHESTQIVSFSAAEQQAFKKELLVQSKSIDAKGLNAKLSALPGWNALDRLLNGFEEAGSQEERAYILSLFLTIIEKRLLKDIPAERKEAFLSKLFYNSQDLLRTYAEESSSSLEKKFAMSWLRSCITDTPEEANVCLGETLFTLLGEKKERALLEKPFLLEEETPRAAYKDVFERSSKFIINRDVRASWLKFIDHLDAEDLKQLSSLFALLGPQGIEIALNTLFAKTWASLEGVEDTSRAKSSLTRLNAAMSDRKTAKALEKSKEISLKIQEFETLAPSFGDPEQFDALLARLNKELLPKAEELCGLLASAEGIGAIILNKTFGEMIASFDNCIKGLTASGAYADNPGLKGERFYQILMPYTKLLESALQGPMLSHDPALLRQAKVLREYLPRRLEEIKKLFENTTLTPEQYKERSGITVSLEELKDILGTQQDFLHPSSKFSAAYAALGSLNMAPERCNILSFEDYFTTVHQSLLKASSSIATKEGWQIEDMPPSVQEICGMVRSLNLHSASFASPTLQSIDWQYPHVRISYNAPLNNHSAQFEVEAELNARGEIVSLIFQGNFFASFNTAGLALRAEDINLYIFNSYYEGGMKASPKAVFSPKADIATVSWQLPLRDPELTTSLEKGSLHLQRIINFLQKYEKLPEAMDSSLLIKEHMEIMPIIYKIGISYVKNFPFHAYFETLCERYTSKDIELFLAYFKITRRVITNPSDEAFQRLIDKILHDDALWARPELHRYLMNFFVLSDPNHYLLQEDYDPADFKAWPVFSYIRSKKLHERLTLLDIPETDKENSVDQSFIKLYRRSPPPPPPLPPVEGTTP